MSKLLLFVIILTFPICASYSQNTSKCDSINIFGVPKNNYTKFDYLYQLEYDSTGADTVFSIYHNWETKSYYQRFAALIWFKHGRLKMRIYGSQPYMEEMIWVDEKIKIHLTELLKNNIYKTEFIHEKNDTLTNPNFTTIAWKLIDKCQSVRISTTRQNNPLVRWVKRFRQLLKSDYIVHYFGKQTGWSYNTPKRRPVYKPYNSLGILKGESRDLTKDLIQIASTTFTMGSGTWYTTAEDDSMLLSAPIPRRATSKDFFISDHEVTNNEYREFIKWVSDSIINYQLNHGDSSIYNAEELSPSQIIFTYTDPITNHTNSIPIFPDTVCWTTEFLYSYNEPMAKYYFKLNVYGNYPVVGVNWYQANAYCIWRSLQLKQILQSEKYEIGSYLPTFRLPTELEWELAARGNKPNDEYEREVYSDRRIYPWSGHELNTDGDYHANYGPVKDINGCELKSFIDDGFFQTAPIRSYLPNQKGLYDVAGNVAEWTSTNDIYPYDYTVDSLTILPDDNLYIAMGKTMHLMNYWNWRSRDLDTNNVKDRYMIEKFALAEMHDAQVKKKNPNGAIVKGGSWANSIIYLQCASRMLVSKERFSSMVGFRVVFEWVFNPD